MVAIIIDSVGVVAFGLGAGVALLSAKYKSGTGMIAGLLTATAGAVIITAIANYYTNFLRVAF